MNAKKLVAEVIYIVVCLMLVIGLSTVVFASVDEQQAGINRVNAMKIQTEEMEKVALQPLVSQEEKKAIAVVALNDAVMATSEIDNSDEFDNAKAGADAFDDAISESIQATKRKEEAAAAKKAQEAASSASAGGAAGRLVIHDLGINVGMVYGCSQAIVDAPDSAAVWGAGSGLVIADHWNQNHYTNIQYSVPGSTIAYVNGAPYVCIAYLQGHNTGDTITDNNYSDIMNTLGAGQVLLYTCNGCRQNVHIAIYQAQ